jgi:hypothetical protein
VGLLPVVVKPSPCFLSEPSGIDHFDEQRAWPVFRVAESFLQNAQNRHADIEADEVGPPITATFFIL